jgi:clan AA aspartic protease
LRGTVIHCREALLPLILISADGSRVEFPVVVDTGFTDDLTLPSSAIRDLELSSDGTAEGELADGSQFLCNVYEGHVIWHDQIVAIEVFETEGAPLLGMRLLRGSRLRVDVVDDGLLEISPLAEQTEGSDSDA